MVMFVVRPVYIMLMAVSAAVGAVYRSRIVSRRGAVVFGKTLFLQSFVMSVGVAVNFSGTCLFVAVVFWFIWNFW